MDAVEPTRQRAEGDDLYALLQVSARADVEVIEAAYRILARRYHPDVSRSADATATMARLNAAWETLRDPAARAAYDASHLHPGGVPAATGPVGWAAEVIADRREPAAGPVLLIEPETIDVGRVPQGAHRQFAVSVETEPPGIRVTSSVPAGTRWLTTSPTVLKGLEREWVAVRLRTRGMKLGAHRGAIELSTSWERRAIPVHVVVVPASLAFRAAGLARLAATNALVLAGLALILLLVGLAAIAAR